MDKPNYSSLTASDFLNALSNLITIRRTRRRSTSAFSSNDPAHNLSCKDNSAKLEECLAPKAKQGPQYVVPFRQFIPLAPLRFKEEFPSFSLACVPIHWATGGIDVHIAADLTFEQRWFFQQYAINNLISTIALAPGEELKIQIKETQRKYFEQKTLDQVEEMESKESTLLDKDVLNVTRSSAKSKTWNVNGNIGITIPVKGIPLSLQLGGGYTSTINETSQNTVESITEETTKSSRSLKNLRSIEVKTIAEDTLERGTTRTVTNPYSDRTLLIKVFELVKQYCIETALHEVSHAVIVTIKKFEFNRSFVLNNRSFIEEFLLDKVLQMELGSALHKTVNLNKEGVEARAIERAEWCLHYLFSDEVNIFNVDTFDNNGTTIDNNQPSTSFNARLDESGLEDALDNKLGYVFTTLNTYYKVYKDLIAPTNGKKELAVDLALSLSEYIRPFWDPLARDEDPHDVMDEDDRTEIFRRISGFLAMVSGFLKPLVSPLEHERELNLAAQRAEFVIKRVIEHINCHLDYYTEKYLNYIARTTSLLSIKEFIEKLFNELNHTDLLKEQFDVDGVFLDRNRIIVPSRHRLDFDDIKELAREIDGEDSEEITLGVKSVKEVTVPLEGAHFEPVVGNCILDSPPPPKQADCLDLSIKTKGCD